MPLTYELVTSTALTSDVSTIDITSLPTAYTDLIIIGFINGFDVITGNPPVTIRLNGDTGSNYMFTSLYNTSGDFSNSNTKGLIGAAGVGITSTSMPVAYIAHVMNYNSNKFKNVISRSGSSVGSGPENINATTWKNTAAVTSITVGMIGNTPKMKSGSSIEIYGIKKA